jgi:hypothetical protein
MQSKTKTVTTQHICYMEPKYITQQEIESKAVFAEQAGSFDLAISLYGQAAQKSGYPPLYRDRLVWCYLKSGKIAEALQIYLRLEVMPGPIPMLGLLQKYYEFTDEKLHVNILRLIRALISSGKVNVQALNSFSDSAAQVEYFPEDVVAYRYHDGKPAGEILYLSPDVYDTIQNARNKLAIKEEWNRMIYVDTYNVYGPFFALVGSAQWQDTLPGGGVQYLIPTGVPHMTVCTKGLRDEK